MPRPRRRGAAQAVVDRGAEAGVRDRRDGDARRGAASASCRRSNSLAAASTRSPEALSVASPATGAEADQPFAGSGARRRRGAAAWPAHNGWRAGRALRSRPAASSVAGRGRSGRGGAGGAGRRSAATIVHSRPCAVGPPSTISGMRPPRLARTCSARVGLIRPLALADGAASGLPTASSRSRIAGWAGRAERDRRQAGGDQRGDRRAGAERQDEGQRAGPVALGERARPRRRTQRFQRPGRDR